MGHTKMKAALLAFLLAAVVAAVPVRELAAGIMAGPGADACCCIHQPLADQRQSFPVVKGNAEHAKECKDAHGVLHEEIHPDCSKNCASTIYAGIAQGVEHLRKGVMNGGRVY